MRRSRQGLMLLGAFLGGLVFLCLSARSKEGITAKTYHRSGSQIHTLRIPIETLDRVSIVVADRVDPLETLARSHRAISAINGGYFDPRNQKTTSFIVQNGRLVADPRGNERLLKNPDLQPYLGRIFNRSEWRQYRCGDRLRSSIAFHRDPVPSGCQILNSIGAGPRLLPTLTAREEGFIEDKNGQRVRDAIGLNQRNARSAIGITKTGDVLWVMVEQNSPRGGLSLPELANFLQELGATEALNLDGGSSASFYYRGKAYYGQRDNKGDRVKRPLKSALIYRGT